MKPLLLLVDLQNDFLSAPGLEPASARDRRKARRDCSPERARPRVPVVHAVTSVDPAARRPHAALEGAGPLEMRAAARRVTPRRRSSRRPPASASSPRRFFSAFDAPELAPALAAAGADTLFVAGVHLHGCVRATVLDAYARGFEVWVAEDAVGSDDPLHAAVTRRYLDGPGGAVRPVEELLARLGARESSGEAGAARHARMRREAVGLGAGGAAGLARGSRRRSARGPS